MPIQVLKKNNNHWRYTSSNLVFFAAEAIYSLLSHFSTALQRLSTLVCLLKLPYTSKTFPYKICSPLLVAIVKDQNFDKLTTWTMFRRRNTERTEYNPAYLTSYSNRFWFMILTVSHFFWERRLFISLTWYHPMSFIQIIMCLEDTQDDKEYFQITAFNDHITGK